MSLVERIARLAVAATAFWSLVYVLVGGTSLGKRLYGGMASAAFAEHEKAGVPMLVFVLPILIMGCVATLASVLPRRTTESNESLLFATRQKRLPIILPPEKCPSWTQRWIRSWKEGDLPLNRIGVFFILFPCMWFLMASCHRKVFGKLQSSDDRDMHIANSFGTTASVALTVLLLPVAKHSSLLKLCQWDPASAVRLHIWSGRIVIIGSIIHGGMHMLVWHGNGESLLNMILPPLGCWTSMLDGDQDDEFQPECSQEGTDCSCYHHFRNLTGFVGLLAFVVLSLASLNWVRRKHYRTFYLTHVLAASVALCMVVLHYDKAVFYVAPSLLFYMGTTIPAKVESWRKKSGTRIHSVALLESPGSQQRERRNPRSCASLTFEATPSAVQKFRAGQYADLKVPGLSRLVSHPFTINRVPYSPNHLRIIFRATGKFTHQLMNEVVSAVQNHHTELPTMQLSGFHGAHMRLEQVLRHDVVVMVAGGIGITPYLSLLHDAYEALSTQSVQERITQQVVLHWICRDEELIEYVMEEYFEPLQAAWSGSGGFSIRIIVHKTSSCGVQTIKCPHRYSTTGHDEVVPFQTTRIFQEKSFDRESRPFDTPLFASGFGESWLHNLPSMLAFCVIAGLGASLVYMLFVIHPADLEVTYRWAFVAVFPFVGVAATILMYVALSIIDMVPNKTKGGGHEWSRLHTGDQDDDEACHQVPPPKNFSVNSLAGLEMSERASFQRTASTLSLSLDSDLEAGVSDEHPVSIEVKEGERPTVHELLKFLMEVQRPALFCCGPAALIQNLKREADERGHVRIRQCIACESPNIAIYEETFEM